MEITNTQETNLPPNLRPKYPVIEPIRIMLQKNEAVTEFIGKLTIDIDGSIKFSSSYNMFVKGYVFIGQDTYIPFLPVNYGNIIWMTE